MTGGLKLLARDAEDLTVISAVLQDSIVPICDVAFMAEEHRFILIANRFKWETAPAEAVNGAGNGAANGAAAGGTAVMKRAVTGDCLYERINCAVRFDGIDKVSTRNLDLKQRGQVLNLLALELCDGAVLLHFSGGAAIRLQGAGLNCHLEDIGEPWPAGRAPCHPAVAMPAVAAG